MKRQDFLTIWGALLIIAGVVFFIQGEPYISIDGEGDRAWAAAWAAIFGVGALSFLWAFLANRDTWWWAVIPGTTLLGLATIIASAAFLPEAADAWMGAIFLGAIGLGFVVVYLSAAERWWAIIPGGTMLSVAALVLLSDWIDGEALASVLFFGLALTFALLYVLPQPGRRAAWALIPAAVMALLGVALLLSFGSSLNYVWAAILILAGVFMLFRQSGRGQAARRS